MGGRQIAEDVGLAHRASQGLGAMRGLRIPATLVGALTGLFVMKVSPAGRLC